MHTTKLCVVGAVLFATLSVYSAPLCVSIEKFSDVLRTATPPSSWFLSRDGSYPEGWRVYLPPGSIIPDGIERRDDCKLKFSSDDDDPDIECAYRLADNLPANDLDERARGFREAVKKCFKAYGEAKNLQPDGYQSLRLEGGARLRYEVRSSYPSVKENPKVRRSIYLRISRESN